MADRIEFELVSPERLLIVGEFDMIVLPGEDGDFGVLRSHAPLISTLRPGTIVIFEDGKITNRIFVASGFAEVTTERLTVMAEQASRIDEIVRVDVKQEISDLRDKIGSGSKESELTYTEAELVIAEAKLLAIDQPAY